MAKQKEVDEEEFCCVDCSDPMTEEESEERWDHDHDGALCDECQEVHDEEEDIEL